MDFLLAYKVEPSTTLLVVSAIAYSFPDSKTPTWLSRLITLLSVMACAFLLAVKTPLSLGNSLLSCWLATLLLTYAKPFTVQLNRTLATVLCGTIYEPVAN
jgi:hypothetical protein